MKNILSTIFCLFIGLNAINAQKGFVFYFAQEAGDEYVEQNGVKYIVSSQANSTVMLALQSHPLSVDDLLLELVAQNNGLGKTLTVNPALVTIESVYDKDKRQTLSCFDPVMLARLYAGEKAVAAKQNYLDQVMQSAGQTGVDSVKSIIRIEASESVAPVDFGLLGESVLSDADEKVAGLLDFPMPNKKCSSIRISVPIDDEIHTFSFAVEVSKDIEKPNTPLINYYYQQQVNGMHKELVSPLDIIFGDGSPKYAYSIP